MLNSASKNFGAPAHVVVCAKEVVVFLIFAVGGKLDFKTGVRKLCFRW